MSWPEDLTLDERIESASEKIDKIISNMLGLIHLHESNKIISGTGILSKKILDTYAANAFVNFRATMMQGEIARLCTFWDTAKANRYSLPTIAKLVDHPDLIKKLWDTTYTNGISINLEVDETDIRLKEFLLRSNEKDARESADRRQRELKSAIVQVQDIEKTNPQRLAAKDYRDLYLSHSLDEAARKRPDLRLKYGDEKRLFQLTLPLIDTFDNAVRNSGFAWESASEMAQMYAKSLWEGCTFRPIE